ncbi:YdbH family protein [Lonsdalea quercina]|uniref:YdbH family protein n=1 Tax=Lonsdalea quercina TaxID=71657 RepID=UPI003976188D
MNKHFLSRVGLGLGAIALVILISWLTLPLWLPRLLTFLAPPGVTVALGERLSWQQGGLSVPGVSIQLPQCHLLTVDNGRLTRQDDGWRLHVASVALDGSCLAHWPQSENSASETSMSLSEWQQRLPVGEMTVERLTLTPWLDDVSALHLTSRDGKQSLNIDNVRLKLQADLVGRTLTLRRAELTALPDRPPLWIEGEVQLSDSLTSLPEKGHLLAGRLPFDLPEAVQATLNWQDSQGELRVAKEADASPLLSLPWRVSADVITVSEGRWAWPYSAQPVSGGLSLALRDWRQRHGLPQIEARVNMLTQGRNGRANAVLTLGPGSLGLSDSDLHIQLAGQANLANLSFSATLPGVLRGALLDPDLVLLPGSLLRAWGQPQPGLTLEDARWPLAGIVVNTQGVSGRLQAIVKAHDAYWGRFNLHMDGKAERFWPDNGVWNWRYWGKGQLPPLQGRWDIAGRGRWKDALLEVSTLSSGLNQLRYGAMTVAKPRLTLVQPLRWQRNQKQDAFAGAFRLVADRIAFTGGGALPPAELNVQVQGEHPNHFLWRGALQAKEIGPVKLVGRWDGERLRGSGWWPPQSLRVFQPLLPPDWKIKLRRGQFYGQGAFSAARVQGFRVGGHWVVKNGSAWLNDGDVSGVDFVLPYRYADPRWQLGISRPVSLRIAELNSGFRIQNIRADVFGAYPYSDRHPLTLAGVEMGLLRGKVSLTPLRFPQHDAALLRMDGVETSELMTAINVKKVALSGRVSGVLPINFNHPTMLVQNGRVTNDGALTLRLDKDLADELAQSDMVSAALVRWLRYLEIDRSDATLQLSNQGELLMKSYISGHNSPRDARQQVDLNYRHQENLFQLWRSLRWGDTIQNALEQRSTQ